MAYVTVVTCPLQDTSNINCSHKYCTFTMAATVTYTHILLPAGAQALLIHPIKTCMVICTKWVSIISVMIWEVWFLSKFWLIYNSIKITSSVAAKVMKEYSYTSFPLMCFYGMDRNNFTVFSNNVIKAGISITKLISQHTKD